MPPAGDVCEKEKLDRMSKAPARDKPVNRKRFGVKRLFVLGEAGVGKSTLLNVNVGLLCVAVDAGKVRGPHFNATRHVSGIQIPIALRRLQMSFVTRLRHNQQANHVFSHSLSRHSGPRYMLQTKVKVGQQLHWRARLV